MKKYCQSCGQGTDYSLKEPKFCGNCGNNFMGGPVAVAVASVVAPQAPRVNPVIKSGRAIPRPNAEDSDGEVEIPDIRAIQVELETGDFKKNLPTFGELYHSSTPPDGGSARPARKGKIDKKKILSTLRKEGGTDRKG